jgi:hypothetical protein
MSDRNGIDWGGLSWRHLRGWFRGSACLARCDNGHQYRSRWCAMNVKRLAR